MSSAENTYHVPVHVCDECGKAHVPVGPTGAAPPNWRFNSITGRLVCDACRKFEAAE